MNRIIADAPQKVNIRSLQNVSIGTFPKSEVHNNPQSDSHYKKMWEHERNHRIEVEQENISLRKIIFRDTLDHLCASIMSQIGRWS